MTRHAPLQPNNIHAEAASKVGQRILPAPEPSQHEYCIVEDGDFPLLFFVNRTGLIESGTNLIMASQAM